MDILKKLGAYVYDELTRLHKMRKPILTLFLIYLLGISAVLRANFYYIDDMGRALWGYKEFYYFSRYIPQYFSTVLHADSYLTDISPLPQLVAVLLISLSAVIILYIVTGRCQYTVSEYIAMIPLGLSPYFLECLSYKYDSPYMALSVLAAVIPVVFIKRGHYCYFFSIFVCTLVLCMSYQAASGIFPMLVILLALIQWNHKVELQSILRFVLISAGGYLAGMLFFVLLLMRPADTYVSTSLPPLAEIIPLTLYHLKRYYSRVCMDFKLEWLGMIGILCASFVYTSIRNSKQKKWNAFIIWMLGLLALFALAFGLYPVLSKPSFEPRSMYGFGVMLSLVAIVTVSGNHSSLSKLVCIALSWCFIVFGFTYGNALNAQKEYTDYRINAVIHDLDELDLFDEETKKTYQIEGSIGYAPEIMGMPSDYEILKRLVPITFSDSEWEWGRFAFSHYYRLKNIEWDNTLDLTQFDLPVLKDTYFHTICGDDAYVLIRLKW